MSRIQSEIMHPTKKQGNHNFNGTRQSTSQLCDKLDVGINRQDFKAVIIKSLLQVSTQSPETN